MPPVMVNPLEPDRYSLQDLKDALKAQGSSLKPGSVLLLRTGWMQAYVKSTPAQKTAMAPMKALKACGIEDTREMVAWMWDSRVAAIGTDCPAVEQWPWDFRNEGALHYRTLSLLGLPLGEQFDLEELADLLEEEKPSAVRKVREFIKFLDGGKAEPV